MFIPNVGVPVEVEIVLVCLGRSCAAPLRASVLSLAKPNPLLSRFHGSRSLDTDSSRVTKQTHVISTITIIETSESSLRNKSYSKKRGYLDILVCRKQISILVEAYSYFCVK